MPTTSNYDYPSTIRDQLAHCRQCLEPMYCIYDSRLRDYCHRDARRLRVDRSSNLRTIRLYIVRP